MRIFYASDRTPNGALDSNLWRDNLYGSLVDLGHDVIEFNYDLAETYRHVNPASSTSRRFIASNRPRVSRELLAQVAAAHAVRPIDLFFSYFYDACVTPSTITTIRDMGIKTVNWYCNGSYQLELVREISPRYDYCLVPEKFRMDDYRRMGAVPIYCQEGANPTVYYPYDVAQEYDVTFVGQAYGERPGYVKYLRETGIDVQVWGPGWHNFSDAESAGHRRSRRLRTLMSPQILNVLRRRVASGHRTATHSATRQNEDQLPTNLRIAHAAIHAPLSDLELVKMYSRSKINLGFSGCGETHLEKERIVQVRLRDFEVPMSGGFYMVEYMDELAEFFEIGVEIVCYSGPKDLADKVRYYLSHDDERQEIRQRGQSRCVRDHTWRKRLTDAFAQMDGLPT